MAPRLLPNLGPLTIMLRLFNKRSRDRAAYRAASYGLAIVLVASAHAAIASRAAQMFA